MVMYANISVNVHYIQIAVMKYVNRSILCLQAGPWGEGQWNETTQIGDPEYR